MFPGGGGPPRGPPGMPGPPGFQMHMPGMPQYPQYPGMPGAHQGMMGPGAGLSRQLPGAPGLPPPPTKLPPPPMNTVVYVGKISPVVDDRLMRAVLELCGPVKSWSRTTPPDGKPVRFGFCEFQDAEGVLRAQRVLKGYPLAGSELVVNLPGAAAAYLNWYNAEKQAGFIVPRPVFPASSRAGADGESPEEGEAEREEGEMEPKALTEEEADAAAAAALEGLVRSAVGDDEAISKKIMEMESSGQLPPPPPPPPRKDTQPPPATAEQFLAGLGAPGEAPAPEKPTRRGETDEEREQRVAREEQREKDKLERMERERVRKEEQRRKEEATAETRRFEDKERSWRRQEDERAREREKEKERLRDLRRMREEHLERDTQEDAGASDSEELRRRVERRRRDQRGREERKRKRQREIEEDEADVKAEALEEEAAAAAAAAAAVAAAAAAAEAAARREEAGAMDVDEEEAERPASPLTAAMFAAARGASSGDLLEASANGAPVASSAAAAAAAAAAGKVGLGVGVIRKPPVKKALPRFFAEEEEDDDKPKRTLIPLKFTKEELRAAQLASTMGGDDDEEGAPSAVTPGSAPSSGKCDAKAREKREKEKLQALIMSIPKEKEELFAFAINWGIFDREMMIETVAKWTAKKVHDLLGQEEQSMVEFIVEKVAAHAGPAELIDELQAILDSETEAFVLKLWRMIIFETLKVEKGVGGPEGA